MKSLRLYLSKYSFASEEPMAVPVPVQKHASAAAYTQLKLSIRAVSVAFVQDIMRGGERRQVCHSGKYRLNTYVYELSACLVLAVPPSVLNLIWASGLIVLRSPSST